MPPAPQLVLASQSPRRRELLAQLGLRFEVLVEAVEERARSGESPADYAHRIALEKALAVQGVHRPAVPVLGADTDVVLGQEILGKPRDEADALRMLAALAGREHQVYSAVAVIRGSEVETALSVTQVVFGVISEDSARAYWATGEPAGKAGAYAIQGLGAQFVREIRGSYTGVVGLPLFETCGLLARFGIHPLR